jgi:mannose-6-phosphate isomerase-like protein (cupin superfamily)
MDIHTGREFPQCYVCHKEAGGVRYRHRTNPALSLCSENCRRLAIGQYPLEDNPTPAQLRYAVRQNRHYRQVIYTDRRKPLSSFQLVAMYIPPQSTVGWERHQLNAQYFKIEQGGSGARLFLTASDELVVDADRNRARFELVEEGSVWMVRSDQWHDVATADDPACLLTIYYPPHHADNVMDHTKEDADAREKKEELERVTTTWVNTTATPTEAAAQAQIGAGRSRASSLSSSTTAFDTDDDEPSLLPNQLNSRDLARLRPAINVLVGAIKGKTTSPPYNRRLHQDINELFYGPLLKEQVVQELERRVPYIQLWRGELPRFNIEVRGGSVFRHRSNPLVAVLVSDGVPYVQWINIKLL